MSNVHITPHFRKRARLRRGCGIPKNNPYTWVKEALQREIADFVDARPRCRYFYDAPGDGVVVVLRDTQPIHKKRWTALTYLPPQELPMSLPDLSDLNHAGDDLVEINDALDFTINTFTVRDTYVLNIRIAKRQHYMPTPVEMEAVQSLVRATANEVISHVARRIADLERERDEIIAALEDANAALANGAE